MSSWYWTSKTLKGTPDFSRFRVFLADKVSVDWTCDRCTKALGFFEYPRDNNLPVECSGCGCAITVVVTVGT